MRDRKRNFAKKYAGNGSTYKLFYTEVYRKQGRYDVLKYQYLVYPCWVHLFLCFYLAFGYTPSPSQIHKFITLHVKTIKLILLFFIYIN